MQAANDNIRTFQEAAESYVANGGSGQYLPKIVDHFGPKRMTEIYPFDVREFATALLPQRTNATRNRQVITPVRAICYHAYDRGWSPIVKIRSLREEPPKRKNAASPPWIHAFVRQCENDNLPHVAALVLFMSQTGARVSEAVSLEWQHVDLVKRTALLVKTKTDRNSVRFMTDQLVNRLYQLREDRKPEDRVFRYRCRHSVNERIAAVCVRAGIKYKPTHTCGRHAFANNALSMGIDIKSIMDAGGWRSPVIFLNVYANPRNAGRVVAERFNTYQYDNDL